MSPIRAVPGLDSDYSPTPQDRVLDNLINRPIPAAAQKSGIDVSNWSVQKKVEEAIKLSLPMMSAEMQKQMKELTKPENIAALAAGITALGVAHAYGIGQIVDGVLLAQFGVENTTKLLQFVVGAVTAERGSDLQLAAKNFSDVPMRLDRIVL